MKNFKLKLSYRQMSAFFAFLFLALITNACAGKPEMPTEAASQALVKSTISDLADAINTGNFKVIRAKASQDFQMSVSEEKLVSTFKTYTDGKDTSLPMLKQALTKDAKFSPAPAIREENGSYVLVTNGSYPLTEESYDEVKFDNEYVWRDGAWKLLKISVEFR